MRSKVNQLVLHETTNDFCNFLLEFVFDSDMVCLQGTADLADARTRLLIKATETSMFSSKVEKSLKELRNYLVGLEMSLGIVVHKSCHDSVDDFVSK